MKTERNTKHTKNKPEHIHKYLDSLLWWCLYTYLPFPRAIIQSETNANGTMRVWVWVCVPHDILLCLCTFYLLIIFCLFLAAVCVVCMCTTCHHALHSLNKRKRVITWPGRSRACSLAQTVKRPNCRVDSVLYCVCIWVCVTILFVFRKSNWELKHCSKNAITKADMHVLYLSAKCFKSVCVFRWRNIKLQNTMFEYTL